MHAPRCSGALKPGTQAVRCRIPAALPARCSSASDPSPDGLQSLCGIFTPWTGRAAVRVRIHDVRVVREHGGRLRSRMSSARGTRAARAALQRARVAPPDGRPREAGRRCPTGHSIGAQPVCATHFIPAHHQGFPDITGSSCARASADF